MLASETLATWIQLQIAKWWMRLVQTGDDDAGVLFTWHVEDRQKQKRRHFEKRVEMRIKEPTNSPLTLVFFENNG